ncbi:apoptosis-associated speck-like protein containing a CARD [Sander lucioperca]|uniref:PYD and CARD domain containing n=1 Tax=Sander lucioperca TaxID=283035 RepID=A0A8C9Y896_SANLU|nr:apoptosis-associated speck-like protein containing a CARD [Sander lucioperca]
MAPKTIKKAISDALEDLSPENLEKFRVHLIDRRDEPRVRRNRVAGKNFLEIADVLVTHFTEAKAPAVAVEILNDIGCAADASSLEEETVGQSSKLGSSGTATPSPGPTGVNTTADGKHFVDKHRIKLIERVSNIAAILDELLEEDVIQEETYDKIRVLPTCQDKMRELYSGPLKAGGIKGKDKFYTILEKKERFLVDELKEMK